MKNRNAGRPLLPFLNIFRVSARIESISCSFARPDLPLLLSIHSTPFLVVEHAFFLRLRRRRALDNPVNTNRIIGKLSAERTLGTAHSPHACAHRATPLNCSCVKHCRFQSYAALAPRQMLKFTVLSYCRPTLAMLIKSRYFTGKLGYPMDPEDAPGRTCNCHHHLASIKVVPLSPAPT